MEECEEREPLQRLVRRRPMYLQLETVSACNARCVFCPYVASHRPRCVMEQPLFEKVLDDYIACGGGALSLSPLTGDVLLDPQLKARLAALGARRAITHLSFHTNGIGWGRLAPAVKAGLVSALSEVTFSLGGLDRDMYHRLYGVDGLEAALAAVIDFCRLRQEREAQAHVRLLLNVDEDPHTVLRDPRIGVLRLHGVDEVVATNAFHNWGGSISAEALPPGARLLPHDPHKPHPCSVLYTAPMVLVDGSVTACGCANATGEALILGDCSTQPLAEIWRGDRFRALEQAFGTDGLPAICRNCTYYDDSRLLLNDPRLANFRIGDSPWVLLRGSKPQCDSAVMARQRADR